MRVLLIGGGGREHAIARSIAKNPRVNALFALPGNAGIAEVARCFPIAATDIPGIVSFAKEHAVDFAVVAPDDPLVLGAVDALTALGIRCFGPDKKAARIEGSKAFAKAFMKRHGIPTAAFETFDEAQAALAYAESMPLPLVIKADGLALGKGVVIAETRDAARNAILSMMEGGRFGDSGRRVVIEEYMTGPEVTVLAFVDGETVVPMVSSMDHKRALDGDLGENTGGMGVIAPNPFYTEALAARCMEEIFLPTAQGLAREGCPFRGCLYFGLMLTAAGPRVIEYNCRFGDPEAQAVLSLLESDLLTVLEAVADGRLAEADVRFADKAACCVMAVSGGYPGAYEKGLPIEIGLLPPDVVCYHSGTTRRDGALVTAGGRVLGLTAVADTLPEAIDRAYRAVEAVRFEGMAFRRDIGGKRP